MVSSLQGGALVVLIHILASSVGAASAPPRTVVPFGGGWRFHWGEAPDATRARPSSMADFQRRDKVKCSGLQWNAHINMGLGGDCATSCAYQPSCMAWVQEEGWPNCHHGTAATVCEPGGTATVHTRAAASALQRNYSFAQPDFQEGEGWEDVTIPHDFSINRTFSAKNCAFASKVGIDGYKAYLPRNASWYRKKFWAPATFQGQTMSLHFEGAYQFTEVYLNGEFVMSHRNGYTGFTVRLDNVTALKYVLTLVAGSGRCWHQHAPA